MDTSRKTAILVGILYIMGTVAGVLSVVFTQPLLDEPDYLVRISANAGQVVTGALCVLIMGLALALVPVVIFPILKKHNEILAMGYVVFRGALETTTYLVVVISFLLLGSLGRAAGQFAALDTASLQMLSALFVKAQETGAMTTQIIFPVGALMLYAVLYQSRLIPRWISVWGAIGVILHLIGGILHIYGVIGLFSSIQDVLAFPIFVQEMVMAIWLIAKGFNPTAIAAGQAQAETI